MKLKCFAGIDWEELGIRVGVFLYLLLCLGVVCMDSSSLPSGVLLNQWSGLCLLGMLVLLLMLLPLVCLKDGPLTLAASVSWCLVLLGFVEVVWGLCQVYGLAYSNHSLFPLTGSFYNPGPYSGYLAMVFPVCLYEWLRCRRPRMSWRGRVALAVLLLVLCVLPAGMSRSAWLAAGVSSLYVLGMHFRASLKEYARLHRKRVWGYALAAVVLAGVALGGAYGLKKDSADGRLFMWKIAARAVAERPWTGYGWDAIPAVYGQAQEEYFASGQYTETEERVAATPDYVFNEYLQVAMAWGIPALVAGLLVLAGAVYLGNRRGEYGICGALLSLAVFSFSSYPLQFPGFVAALVLLVLVCYLPQLPYNSSYFLALVILLLSPIMILLGRGMEKADRRLSACREWSKSRVFYQSGAYERAVKAYSLIHEDMKWNARFLFEYGHALNKLYSAVDSNNILEEALKVSGDPMILNIMAKNERMMGHYEKAEALLLRSVHRLPGRIYPYYLLTRLYAIPDFYQPEKLKRAARVVLEKEPKVPSTAVREMRQEVQKILKKL